MRWQTPQRNARRDMLGKKKSGKRGYVESEDDEGGDEEEDEDEDDEEN